MSQMLEYHCMMIGCLYTLPKSELQKLDRWEKENLDGCTVGTSDWPGWEKYIGKKPITPQRPSPKIKKSIPLDLRIRVYRRDDFHCVFCGSEEHLTIDHKIPESKGGLTVFENLQTACWPCNLKKGSKL